MTAEARTEQPETTCPECGSDALDHARGRHVGERIFRCRECTHCFALYSAAWLGDQHEAQA